MYGDTDKLLAIKFPHVPRSWLEQVEKELAETNGNVEMTTRFVGGEDQWTDWKKRVFRKLRLKLT